MAYKGFNSIDISGYQRRPPAAWFDEVAKQVKLVFIQLWGGQPGPLSFGPNADAEYQLSMFNQRGVKVAGYIWIPPDDSTTRTGEIIKAAKKAAGELASRLVAVAVDVEGPRLLHSTAPMRRLLDAYLNTAVHFPEAKLGIYSSFTMWQRCLGSVDAELPLDEGEPKPFLWDANYVFSSGSAPEQAPFLDYNWRPYGGWKARAVLQYAGTVDLHGVGADLNVADLAALGSLQQEKKKKQPKVSDEEKKGDKGTLASKEYDDLLSKFDSLDDRLTALEERVNLASPKSSKQPMRTRSYTVQPGDTLSQIAQRFLGQAGRFKEIVRLNNLQDPNRIYVGQVLKLPLR